jgi:hypothetical protein
VIFLGTNGRSGPFIVPGAVVGALVLVVGPWIWQLTSERAERIRIQERAEVAARIHGSVLQTSRSCSGAGDPQRVACSRGAERELRRLAERRRVLRSVAGDARRCRGVDGVE